MVAAAAYRSGALLRDERYGEVHDFRKRSGVAWSEVLAPAASPEWARDREGLWNAVEARERHPRAQLAREFQLNLPHELSHEDRVELVRGFVRAELVSHGLAVDAVIHKPDRLADHRNHHAHLLATLRALGAGGFEKLKARELNVVEQLIAWREAWAARCNRALEQAQVMTRVTHLSYAVRGIDREAQPKVGPLATELERRGVRTFAGDEWRSVAERNAAREVRREVERERSERGSDRRRSDRDVGNAVDGDPLIYSSNTKGGEAAAAEKAVRNGESGRAARDRALLFDERYGKWVKDIAKSVGWKQRRALSGELILEPQKRDGTKVVDRGADIMALQGSEKEVEVALALAEAKGWKSVEFTGTDEFKRLAMRRALERGFMVDVQPGRDAGLLAQVRSDLLAQRGPDIASAAQPPRRDPSFVVDSALNDVTFTKSTFTMRDVERELASRAKSAWEREPTPGELALLRSMAEQHPELLVVAKRYGEQRFTTTTVRDTERRLFEDVEALRATRDFETPPEAAKDASERLTLSDEQAKALEHITAPGRAAAIIGFAGTGKSHMLGAAREVWEARGYSVVGAALAGIAAEGLESGSKIPSATIASRLNQWRGELGEPPRDPLSPKSVIVIDEAGMVGSRAMAELVRVAQDADAKLVFVGDYEQLQSIEAGAAFRGIVERIGAADIKTVRRQNEPWMRDATIEMAEGKTVDALRRYEAAGMVHDHVDLGEAKAALIDRWRADRQANPSASQIVLAFKVVDVRDLNERARALRRTGGELGDDVEASITGRSGKPESRQFAVNDRVYFLKNSKSLGVMNGTLGTVKEIERTDAGPRFVIDVSDGKDPQKAKLVRFGVADYSSLDHGYAATVHKSQGVTVDRAYVLASSGFDRHLTYVGQSRHRLESHLYWSNDQFKDRQQLDRVLSRMARNDNALDYERGDVPREERVPTFMRTLSQASRDLDAWVRTSAELLRSAAVERPGLEAQRGRFEVVGAVANSERGEGGRVERPLAAVLDREGPTYDVQRAGFVANGLVRRDDAGRPLDGSYDFAARFASREQAERFAQRVLSGNVRQAVLEERRGPASTDVDVFVGEGVDASRVGNAIRALASDVADERALSGEDRALVGGAELAHRAVSLWRADLEVALAELRTAGETVLPVVRSGADPRERLDRLVDAIEAAVSKVRARVRDAERAPAFDVPVRLIDSRAVTLQAGRLMESANYADVAVGLVAATGRKPSEILRSGRFEVDRERPGSVLYAAQDGERDRVAIPVLGDPQKVVNTLSRLREQRDFAALSAAQVQARVGPLLSASLQKNFGEGLRFDDVRAMYAAAAFERDQPAASNLRYYAQILSYSVANERAAQVFARYSAAPLDRAVTEYERGFKDVRAALREAMATSPSSPEREAVAQRIRTLDAQRVVPGAPVSLAVDVSVARDVVAERLERVTQRLAIVHSEYERGWPKEVPLSPADATKKALEQGRDLVRVAATLTTDEQRRLTELQSRLSLAKRNANLREADSAQRLVDGIYQARDAREDDATRRFVAFEQRIQSPQLQAQMKAEYEEALRPLRPAFAAQESRRVLLDQLRGEREGLLEESTQLQTLARYEREASPLMLRMADGNQLEFDGLGERVELLGAEIGTEELEIDARSTVLEVSQ